MVRPSAVLLEGAGHHHRAGIHHRTDLDRVAVVRPSRSELRRTSCGRCRRRHQPEDDGEREAPVRGAVRLCASDEHLLEDRARSRLPGSPRTARPQLPYRRAVLTGEAARRANRRGRPRGGRRIRRFALSAATSGAAVLPDAICREAFQPHPFDASA